VARPGCRGHVNHVVFLTYLEESRDEWLGGRLGDPDRVWDWVVAHVEVDYRRQRDARRA
jgi:acyl-CoA thioesterase FadM